MEVDRDKKRDLLSVFSTGLDTDAYKIFYAPINGLKRFGKQTGVKSESKLAQLLAQLHTHSGIIRLQNPGG